ncbi:MAG: PfkB family carbohydrate kinase, partial [Treponema sp.]|nr:PfkB family carbohydrate kinase [Treponema sp.]
MNSSPAATKAPEMSCLRLKEILSRFPSLRIAVVGDLFLDKWLEIDRSLDEVSLETGLTAYQVTAKRLFAGAAGTVLSNLSALEVGELYALGFVGDDGEGFELRRILQNLGVNSDALVVSDTLMTPTYTKPVFRRDTGEEETNRLDHRNIHPTPRDVEERIIDSIRKVLPKVDALIALDQLTSPGVGVLSPRVREELGKAALAYPEVIFYADSRAFITEFRNMIVKCNDAEALRLFYPEARDRADGEKLEECLRRLAEITGRRVFITCGERGVLGTDENGRPSLVPALAQGGKIDIVGAGDACTSGIVTTLCCGGTAPEAAFVGNLVSSIT